jgi:signal transduction histidine kinase
MTQLFQNMIGNALKFRADNRQPEVTISGHILTIEDPTPGRLAKQQAQIAIQDNGIGFDERYADRIFNVFQRLEGNKYPGSGIGLAICRKVIVRHGGTIQAQGIPAVGATFTIHLPLHQDNHTTI